MFVLLLASALSGSALAACPAAPAELATDLDAAYADYARFDLGAFSARTGGLHAAVACVNAPVAPAVAAKVHLVAALEAWVAKDPGAMLASFRGLVAVDPGFDLSADIAPPGSRMRTVFEEARAAGPGESHPLPVSADVRWVVDGQAALVLAAERAALVQRIGPDSSVATIYILDGALPAAWGPPVAAAPTAPALPERRIATSNSGSPVHLSRTLVISGLAAGVAAGASIAVAAETRSEFFDATALDEANALYGTNRALGFTGIGLGVAAVGLGATAVVVGKW